MKRIRSRAELKFLVTVDQIKEHCEYVAVLAGLLAASGRDSITKVIEPELASRAGNLILNEIRMLDETLQKLCRRMPKSK